MSLTRIYKHRPLAQVATIKNGNGPSTINRENVSESSSNSPTPTSETTAKTETVVKSDGQTDHSRSSKGGQVVETGKYHLEFLPEKEANKTHLDFYVLKGDNHETVSNAKVTADIQLPDGKLKTIPLSYDAEGKHYVAALSEKLAGQYQVKMTADNCTASESKINNISYRFIITCKI